MLAVNDDTIVCIPRLERGGRRRCGRREAEIALERAGGHLRVAMGLTSKLCSDAPELGELDQTGAVDSKEHSGRN